MIRTIKTRWLRWRINRLNRRIKRLKAIRWRCRKRKHAIARARLYEQSDDYRWPDPS